MTTEELQSALSQREEQLRETLLKVESLVAENQRLRASGLITQPYDQHHPYAQLYDEIDHLKSTITQRDEQLRETLAKVESLVAENQRLRTSILLPGLREALRLMNLNYSLDFAPGTIMKRIEQLEGET